MNNNLYKNYNSKIRSPDNLKKYWGYSHPNRNDNGNTDHNARILNIESYYRIV